MQYLQRVHKSLRSPRLLSQSKNGDLKVLARFGVSGQTFMTFAFMMIKANGKGI